MRDARYWIRRLRLRKHPEGGYYREVYRANESVGARGLPGRYKGKRAWATSIYYLLDRASVSRFHRLKSDETWYFHAGDRLVLHTITRSGRYARVVIGPRKDGLVTFQYTVPRGMWFGAAVAGGGRYSLVSCAVAPGFDFSDFRLGHAAELKKLCPRAKKVIERLT
jgi:uncharacterized protein